MVAPQCSLQEVSIMRTTSLLRTGKRVGFVASIAFAVVVAVGFSALVAKGGADGEMGDMESFIKEKVFIDPPVSGLGEFLNELPEPKTPTIVVPVPNQPMRSASVLSDGKFETLDPKWKKGVERLVKSGACDQHDMAIAIASGADVGFLLAKAQAIVESNCNHLVVGTHDDVGLYQVRAVACTEAGVKGDRTDVFVNASCAARYRKVLCTKYRSCDSLATLFVSYNRGPTGAKKVSDASAMQYARKIHFVMLLLIRQSA